MTSIDGWMDLPRYRICDVRDTSTLGLSAQILIQDGNQPRNTRFVIVDVIAKMVIGGSFAEREVEWFTRLTKKMNDNYEYLLGVRQEYE